MSGRVYTVEFESTAEAVQVDFFELTPADDLPLEIFGLFLSQTSEVGDAQDEMIRYRVIRGNATSGSGGGTPTPQPVDPKEQAASFSAKSLNTTIASTGTPVNLHSGAFNVRSGEQIWLPEGAGWRATQANTLLVVRLMAAPADSVSFSGTCYVREF